MILITKDNGHHMLQVCITDGKLKVRTMDHLDKTISRWDATAAETTDMVAKLIEEEDV